MLFILPFFYGANHGVNVAVNVTPYAFAGWRFNAQSIT